MRFKDACLVVTPRDGKNLTKLMEIRAILKQGGWNTRVAVEGYDGQALKLATEAAQQGCELVIAFGGDGTVSQVVNGVMRANATTPLQQPCVVGVLPGGTVNLWSVEIGVPADPVQAARALVESVVRTVDLGYVTAELPTHHIGDEIDTHQSRHYFLLMTGLGFDANVMSQVNRSLKHRLGILAVALTALKLLPQTHHFPARLWSARDSDGHEVSWQGKALQVMVSNTRQHANHANSWEMAPGAFVDDGMLDVCVIMPDKPLMMLRQAASLLLRRRPDEATARFFRAPHFELTLPATTNVQLDGDLMQFISRHNPYTRGGVQQSSTNTAATITYQFRVLPHILHMAIPSHSNNIIFQDPLVAAKPLRTEV